jgi:hypothetical protein
MTAGKRASLHDSERRGGWHRLKPALGARLGRERSSLQCHEQGTRRPRLRASKDVHCFGAKAARPPVAIFTTARSVRGRMADEQEPADRPQAQPKKAASWALRSTRRRIISQARVSGSISASKYGRATTSNSCRSAASDLSRPAPFLSWIFV